MALGIVTANRPYALRRVLYSYAIHAQRHARTLPIFIADQSDPRTEESNRCIAANITKLFGCPISFYGRLEKLRLCRALEEVHVPLPVSTFALLGTGFNATPYGANRNTLLLAATRRRMLCADDDTICYPVVPSKRNDETHPEAIGTNNESFRCFSTRTAAMKAVHGVFVDVFGEHDRALDLNVNSPIAGSTVNACALQIGNDPTQDAPSVNNSVKLSISGSVGDCGMTSPWWLIREAHKAQNAPPNLAAIGRTLQCREIARYTPRLTISRRLGSFAMTMAVDNTSFLPPFVPHFRNEDHLFGFLLMQCDLSAYKACVPHMIIHSPVAARTYDINNALCITMSDVLGMILDQAAKNEGGTHPLEQLHDVGRKLDTLTHLPMRSFHDFAQDLLTRWRAIALADLMAVDQWADSPLIHQWLAPHIARLGQRQSRSPCFHVGDLSSECPGVEHIIHARNYVRALAMLLRYWSTITEVAPYLCAPTHLRPSIPVDTEL
jgi:hypothetical protein